MSSLSAKYGAQGRVGAQGENYWAQALKRAGLDKFEELYSLNIPDVPGRPSMRGDIDCVIANGNKVVLVDVKRWRGFILWTNPLDGRAWNLSPLNTTKNRLSPLNRVLKFLTGRAWSLAPLDRSGKKLSENMRAARDRVRYHLPEAEISAMVVFVPTKDRDQYSVPRSVHLLIWPGMIFSYTSGRALDKLRARLGDDVADVPSSTIRLLARLKRYG